MPNAFLSIETNFPTFNADQKTEDKIDSMVNYLFILVEQLRYTLNNLDLKNFNQTALTNFAADTTEEVVEAVTTLATHLNQTDQNVNSLARRVATVEGLTGRVSDLEDAMDSTEAAISDLQGNIGDLQAADAAQQQRLAALELWKDGTNNDGAAADIADLKSRCNTMAADLAVLTSSVAVLVEEMTALNGVITIDQNNNVELGNLNKITNLKGIVQINGAPIVTTPSSGTGSGSGSGESGSGTEGGGE